MTTDSYIRAQYLQLIGAGFLIFVLVFVSCDFEVSRSRRRPYGANLFIIYSANVVIFVIHCSSWFSVVYCCCFILHSLSV